MDQFIHQVPLELGIVYPTRSATNGCGNQYKPVKEFGAINQGLSGF